MINERAFLVISLTILGVVAFNVMIYLAWRDKSLSQMVDMFRRAAHRANDPWEEENASLSELNQLVKQLHENAPDSHNPDTQRENLAKVEPGEKSEDP